MISQPLLYLILFLYIDLMGYVVHRLFHSVPFLWQLHKLHHSSKELNAGSGERFNFLEGTIFFIFQELPLLLLFGEQITPILLIIFFYMDIIFATTHTNIKFKLPFLSYFMVTPHFHLWHHAYECKYKYGQNYAGILSIWDRLFGTCYWNIEYPQKLGFAGQDKYPTNIFAQLLYPIPLPLNKVENE